MLGLRARSLSARITAATVAALLLIGGGSFWVLQAFFRRQMIASLAESTTVHGRLVEQSLRYAMHTRSLALLPEMVRSLGDQRDVQNVMILNKRGEIRFSSDPAERGRVLASSDATCRVCHDVSPSSRGRTVVFTREDGGRVFRNVNPIQNSETCFGCHPPSDHVNGVLIVDYSMAGIDSGLAATARNMWLSAVAVAMAVAVVMVVLLRRLVLARLQRLVKAVDVIESGRLDRPAAVGGQDEIGVLGSHLDRMAVSLAQSLDELRRRERFLDGVINSADDGIVVVDERLRIVAANRAFGAIASARGRGAATGSCHCASSAGPPGADDCPARATFATGEVTRAIRTFGSPDGNARTYEIAASPLEDGSNERRVIEVWRDITLRRKIEAQLASSERLASLGLLAAGISHEINNPLGSITACLDGLRRRLGSSGGELPAELPEYLQLIRGEVERCRELTERLKLLAPSTRRGLAAVDLGAVIRDTVALLRYTAERERVELAANLAPQLAPVRGDEAQVRQLVLNLALNGVQAIDGGGRLLLVAHASESGAMVELEVADTGRGIQAADLKRVFEPFFSARPDGCGSGLGLFMCKIIVDQLGGVLEVASVPGQGTRFTVRLPAAA